MANANPGNKKEETSVRQTTENLNESTPLSQRDPIGNCPKTDGPKMGEAGNFEQAEYPVGEGISRRDR